MKFKHTTLALLLAGTSAFAQIKVNQKVSINKKSNAFLDASQNASNFGNNIGRGLLFPPTDLSTFKIDKAAADGINYPTYFDGMIVYNTHKGDSTTDPNIQTTDNLTVGYYYFSNPNGKDTQSISNGKWIKIGESEVAAAVKTLYTSDGALNENRILRTDGHNLSFTGDGKLGIGTEPNNSLNRAKLQVDGLIRSNNIRKQGNELSEDEAKIAKEVFVDANGIFRVKEADALVGNSLFIASPTCKFTVDRAAKLFWGDNFYVSKSEQKPVFSGEQLRALVKFAEKRGQMGLYQHVITYYANREDKGCESKFSPEVEKYNRIKRLIYCKQKKNPIVYKFDVRYANSNTNYLNISIRNDGYDYRNYDGSRPLINIDASRLLDTEGGPIPICPPIAAEEPAICSLVETLAPEPPRPISPIE